MNKLMNFPLLVFVLSFLALWFSAFVGDFLRKKLRPWEKSDREDFGVVQAGALTLLGLLIGFTFSMAVSRYEERKTNEEAEANAIGTEYIRAGLLPPADAAKVRLLLSNYLDQRVLFYTASDDEQQLRQLGTITTQLQNDLWSSVQDRGAAQPTATVALAVAGMNDVLNSQGYAQAAWWNRIPAEAWVLLIAIGIGCNVLIGYGAHRTSAFLFVILPLAVSVSFFLIADIESPRRGVIRVRPENLLSLSQTLPAR